MSEGKLFFLIHANGQNLQGVWPEQLHLQGFYFNIVTQFKILLAIHTAWIISIEYKMNKSWINWQCLSASAPWTSLRFSCGILKASQGRSDHDQLEFFIRHCNLVGTVVLQRCIWLYILLLNLGIWTSDIFDGSFEHVRRRERRRIREGLSIQDGLCQVTSGWSWFFEAVFNWTFFNSLFRIRNISNNVTEVWTTIL